MENFVAVKSMYSIKDVCQITGLSEATIRRHIKSGYLPARQLGKIWKVAAADLDEYLAGTKAKGKGSVCRGLQYDSFREVVAVYDKAVVWDMAEKVAAQHMQVFEKWKEGSVKEVWFDENLHLCIRYSSGNWWHYNYEKGSLFWW